MGTTRYSLLDSISDYTCETQLRNLIANIDNLKGLAKFGDETAMAIVIDLSSAISKLTEVQQNDVEAFISGDDVSAESTDAIVKEIQKILVG